LLSINGVTEAWNSFIGTVNSTPSTIPGSQRIKEQLGEITREAHTAADALAEVLGKKPLPHLEDKSTQGGGIFAGDAIGDSIRRGSAATKRAIADSNAAAAKAAREAAQLQDAQNALALSRAKTSAARIAELRRQQAATSDPAEKIRLQQQIEEERDSAAKSHTSELNKQLKLNEGIYDSIAKTARCAAGY
jgi:hypothetical protein